LEFRVEVVEMNFASSLRSIGKLSAAKIIKTLEVGAKLSVCCLRRRPELAYFTISPTGGAFLRDVLFASILKTMKIPIVYHIHGKGVSESSSSAIARWLYSYVFKGEKVIQLSSRLHCDISEFVSIKDCFFVTNGIPDTGNSLNWGQEASRQNEKPRILFLSNMVATKGPLSLLGALAELKKRGVFFQAFFAGEWSSIETRNAFYELAKKHDLADCIEYLGPHYGEDKNRVFRSADIFVLPTRKDAFPLVILEAMSFSLPVVSTFEGAIPEIVIDGETGFLVKPGDTKMLSDRLALLIQRKDLREHLGLAGRKRFVENFTSEIFEKNLVRTLKECLQGKKDKVYRKIT
jgi:glycosyltransferase involved in cell wall biosynthesis